ncbi:hypothetical protein Lal_00013471 [Lupinus albus]|nr:hypothetical protein Lal_00013471 [Lupinus albus]
MHTFTRRVAYIVWDVREKDSTTNTYEEEESAKIFLMVNAHEASTSTKVDELSEVNSFETSSCSSSEISPSYDDLYYVFVEQHEELKKIATAMSSTFAAQEISSLDFKNFPISDNTFSKVVGFIWNEIISFGMKVVQIESENLV